jgi:hypothetical protein
MDALVEHTDRFGIVTEDRSEAVEVQFVDILLW